MHQLTTIQIFGNIYDTRHRFEDKARMETIPATVLGVGDFVVMESVIVHTQHNDGWSMSFHAYWQPSHCFSLRQRVPRTSTWISSMTCRCHVSRTCCRCPVLVVSSLMSKWILVATMKCSISPVRVFVVVQLVTVGVGKNGHFCNPRHFNMHMDLIEQGPQCCHSCLSLISRVCMCMRVHLLTFRQWHRYGLPVQVCLYIPTRVWVQVAISIPAPNPYPPHRYLCLPAGLY